MITVCCALYPEARELIRAFQLKRDGTKRHFQLFGDDEGKVRLVITGVGMIAAAVAVAELSSCEPPNRTDLLINFGSRASAGLKPAAVCLCDKLTDARTGRSYYPDVLWSHPFEEAQLVTVAEYMTEEACGRMQEERAGEGACLYDMEAAAVYQAGNYYYGPHQMIFLKAVTDHGIAENGLSAERFGACMDQAARSVVPFLEQLLGLDVQAGEREEQERRAARGEAERLGALFHCTAAMRAELEQLLYYRRIAGIDWQEWIQDCMRDGRLPAKDKREGKILFEKFRIQSYLR